MIKWTRPLSRHPPQSSADGNELSEPAIPSGFCLMWRALYLAVEWYISKHVFSGRICKVNLIVAYEIGYIKGHGENG